MNAPSFAPVTQDAFLADIATLAEHMAADLAWRPTFVVGIGRGGLVPAVFLSHATGLPMLSIDRSSEIADFADAPIAAMVRRTQMGEHLLFVDDINDSGLTIAALRGALSEAGAVPGAVRFATLIDNVGSAERVEYRARTIDRATMKDWFVFPWEAVAPPSSIAEDAAAVPARTA